MEDDKYTVFVLDHDFHDLVVYKEGLELEEANRIVSELRKSGYGAMSTKDGETI